MSTPTPKFAIGDRVYCPQFVNCFGEPVPRVDGLVVRSVTLHEGTGIEPYYRVLAENPEPYVEVRSCEGAERFFEHANGGRCTHMAQVREQKDLLVQISKRELDTIIAALRMWQARLYPIPNKPQPSLSDFLEIARDNGRKLNADEIDTLIWTINTAPEA